VRADPPIERESAGVCRRGPRPCHDRSFLSRSVAATIFAEALDANGIVVDIGRAQAALKTALAPISYRNLDDMAEFRGSNTTTEFVAKYLYDRLADAARAGQLGRDGGELRAIRVTISESHVARAWYEAPLW
jgi:6-pyruvoyl-tetrahydropterin synthase